MKILLSFLVLGILSCDRVQIDFFVLGSFRVMAIVADMPEVDANSQTDVTITPWISDIDEAGRDVALEILACPDPGIGFGQEPTCDSGDSGTVAIAYADFDTTTLASQNFTGPMQSFVVTIPSGLVDGLDANAQYNGIDYIVSMVFSVGDEVIKSFKRIKVSTNPSPNENPKIENILVDASIDDPIVDQSVLTYTIATGFEPQEFVFFNQEGQEEMLEEEYLLTWFVRGGFLSVTRAEPDLDTVFENDPDVSGPNFVVGVLRDSRGGQDVLIRQ